MLAVAAIDEATAAEAIEKIDIEFEPLPFVVDPIESLRPNGPNARAQGNVWMRPTAPPAAPARDESGGVRRRRQRRDRRAAAAATAGASPGGRATGARRVAGRARR